MLATRMGLAPVAGEGRDTGRKEAELARCAADRIYWVNTYGVTYDPREPDPVLPFRLFPRQGEFLDWLAEREAVQEDGVAEKCRDVGFTWLCCAYALHGWLFRPGFKAGFGSRKLDLVDRIGDPDCIFEKLRFLLKSLPDWMRPRGFTPHVHDGYCRLANPENGATITGEGGDNIGRGGRASLYFLDEAAFLEHPQRIDAAISQTSRCKIYVSTPNGTGNTFYKKRFSGSFSVFTFRWQDDPRKDAAWYARQKAALEPAVLAQEVDIDYSASLEGICIPAAWVRAAVGLSLPAAGPVTAGLDIADGGRSRSVLIARQGPAVITVCDRQQGNTTETAWWAREQAQKLGVTRLVYDCVGVGAGVRGTWESSERRLPFFAEALKGGDAATETRWPDGQTSRERFLNLRAELWWGLRVRFERSYEHVALGQTHPAEEMISLPEHAQLIAELSLPRSFTTETGKVRLESKQEMQRRGVASPDYADALAYAFAPPRKRAVSAF